MSREVACNMFPVFSQERSNCLACLMTQDVYIDNFNTDLLVRRVALDLQSLEMTNEELLDWEVRCEEDWVRDRPANCASSSLPIWGINGEPCSS